jgi:hypothetical protein
MKHRARTGLAEIESRELRLTAFICLAIMVLASGLVMLKYPAVFANLTSQHGLLGSHSLVSSLWPAFLCRT